MEKIEDLYNLMVQSKLTKNSFSAFKSEFESSADYRKQIFNTIQSQKGITKLKAFSGANIATFENRYISKPTTEKVNLSLLNDYSNSPKSTETPKQKPAIDIEPYVDPITGKKNDSHLRLADGTPKDGSGDELMEFHMTETRDDAFWKKEKEKQQQMTRMN